MSKVPLCKIFLILIFLLFGVKCVFGGVLFEITPKNPVKGEVVTIEGLSNPKDKVKIEVSFEKVVPVENGTFIFPIKGVDIPISENRFYVVAKKASNLDISVRRKILDGIYTPWITISRSAANNCVSFSRSVPPGNYDIVLRGRSENNSVDLKFTAVSYVECDENGRFKYSYDTSSMPLGVFKVTVGGVTKYITLKDKREAQDAKKPIHKKTAAKTIQEEVTSVKHNASRSELEKTEKTNNTAKNATKKTSKQTVSKDLTNDSVKQHSLVNNTKEKKVEDEKVVVEPKPKSEFENTFSNSSKNEDVTEIKAFNESNVEKASATTLNTAVYITVLVAVLVVGFVYMLRR